MDPSIVRAPLRAVDSDSSGPETDESILISAMLESGDWNPAAYQVTVDDLASWQKLWTFCSDYAAKSDRRAPPIDLVQRKFPDFVPTWDVTLAYAAQSVLEGSHERRMRIGMRKASQALAGDAPDTYAAAAFLREVSPPPVSMAPPMDGLGDWLVEAEDMTGRIVVPHRSLQYVTGGIGPGELWLIGARPGQGKTWTLVDYCCAALEQGFTVGYISLEMRAHAMRKRITTRLTKGNQELLKLLRTPGLDHQRAMGLIREKVTGKLDVIDPSHGRVTPEVVRAFMEGHDLVIIDWMGLISTSSKQRSVEDWRYLGAISNQLVEDKLATGTAILSAVQLNRKAEDARGFKAPPPDTIGGADVLNQDADVIVTQRRPSVRTMVHTAHKNREGPPQTWFSLYDPANGCFPEIPLDKVMQLEQEDNALI